MVGFVLAIVLIIAVSIFAFKISNEESSANISKTSVHRYDSYGNEIHPGDDGRILDGHFLYTDEDWERWWVKKGFADSIAYHISELESDIEDKKSKTAEISLAEWFDYYEKYRSVCLECGMWNSFVGDRKPFQGTADQIAREESIKEQIRHRYDVAQPLRVEYQRRQSVIKEYESAILDYIASQPHHVAVRHTMKRTIADSLKIPLNEVNSVYCGMLRAGTITEEKGTDGKYTTKESRKRVTSHLTDTIVTTPSKYNPAYYADVKRRTIYKIEYTLNTPENVNFQNNTCEFISKSSGRRYQTSLESCSCPAFASLQQPCKHMVALAIKLGYYSPTRQNTNSNPYYK